VGKLNEQTKTYMRVGGYILAAIILIAFGWFLFRDVPNNRATTNDVTEQLDTVAEQQRKAEDAIKSVQSGLDDSERTVDHLDQSNRDAQATTGRIAESNTNIANADSQSRIAECESILQEIRAGAGKAAE